MEQRTGPLDNAILETGSAVPIPNPVPAGWLAQPGELTPLGAPATYHSVPHAAMGLRLAYRQFVLSESASELGESMDLYQSSWNSVVRHAAVIRQIVDMVDVNEVRAAAVLWNAIDQKALDSAFRIVLCEREPHAGKNLATHVWKEYGLNSSPFHPEDGTQPARSGTSTDNNAAWHRASQGMCNGCGMLTISDSQRRKLHRTMERHQELFDLSPMYLQTTGKQAALWPIMTIVAKGVAEHVIPRSRGGATEISNLTNCCACCNYTRGDTCLSAMGAPAYDRPDEEARAQAQSIL